MYIYIHMYIYVCRHVYICIYIHTHIYKCACVYMQSTTLCSSRCARKRLYNNKSRPITCMYMGVCVCVCVCLCVCAHMRVRAEREALLQQQLREKEALQQKISPHNGPRGSLQRLGTSKVNIRTTYQKRSIYK